MTFPFGERTRPLKPAVPTAKLDPVRFAGLY